MISRRAFLAGTAALVVIPGVSTGQQSRLSLKGAIRQGELIVGKTDPGTIVRLEAKPLPVSRDGTFVFGFAYDQKTTSVLDARYADGSMERRPVTPSVRDYEIQRINGLPESLVTPPAEALERIKRESEAMNRARERVTEASWFAEGLDWPVPGIVSSLFGSQRILNGEPRAPHLAVDIAAPIGTPIRAPAEGVVSLTGDFYFDGIFTILDHGQGVSTCYAHQSSLLVKEGEKIVRGQTIGEVGKTGRVTGPNLHWGLNWHQLALDPSLSTPTPLPPKS